MSPPHLMQYVEGKMTRPIGNLPKILPFLHTTEGILFRDIMEQEKLTSTFCNVLNKDLIYFFYGRHAFHTRNGDEQTKSTAYLPVVLIFEEGKITPETIFPFDTGAYKGDYYAPSLRGSDFDKDKDKYSLGNQKDIIPKLVSVFFKDNSSYLKGTPVIHADEFTNNYEAERYYGLISGQGNNKHDSRCSAVEIGVKGELDLQIEPPVAVIVPQSLADSYKTKLSTFGTAVIHYEMISPPFTGNSFFSSVSAAVSKLCQSYV